MSAERITVPNGEQDWRYQAACQWEDPELFFPTRSSGPAARQIEEAKRVCLRCDVRERCLAWAIEEQVVFGVWGGMSEEERQALRRKNKGR